MRLLLLALLLLGARVTLRGDAGDIESSHDYPGFARYPGFVISDYDEDSPASFSFPVVRPLPTDAAHIETLSVTGHRYAIRYALNPDVAPPSLFQMQDYYEKLATAQHFTLEKSGAAGDVTETFHRAGPGHDVWLYLEPGTSVYGFTVLESNGAPPRMSPGATVAAPPPEDTLYLSLMKDGRVILPLKFMPSRAELDSDSRPVLDRVARFLQAHPRLQVSIEGHTDNSGDAGENQRLSEARARATRAFLIERGVNQARLISIGYGGDNAIATNDTAEGRQINRRIELVVIQK